MKKLITLWLVFGCLSGWAQNNYCIENRFSQNYYFDSSQITVIPDVAYAVAKRWPSAVVDSLKLDFFAPNSTIDSLSKRPFILLIHGGAFMMGNKTAMHYQCMEYARRGFVVATMQYRLGWNCTASDLLGVCVLCGGQNYNLKTATYRAVQDARAALRFVYANAQDYGIDTAWLFIGGESAGSITALHTAFWSQSEADTFASFAVGQVGLLDTSGNDLPNLFSIKGVIDNCGAVSRDSVVLNNGNIPVVSFHDENDCVVPTFTGQVISCACQPFYWVWGSSSIHYIMNNAGMCTEMNLVPLSINHCSYPTWNLVRHAACFLKRMMCNECSGGFTNNTGLQVMCDTLQKEPVTGITTLKVSAENPVSYFPNPTTGSLTFDLSNYSNYFPLKMVWYNTLGEEELKQLNINQVSCTLENVAVGTGIHVVVFYYKEKVIASTKVVVE